MTKPRVRFAPSPTGYLHIGGARTALFNWLWARKTGGAFVLRIEDTDQARSTRESVDAIFDAMRWLGLDWDEGPRSPDDAGGGPHAPYFQMKRLDAYRAHAEALLRAGHAYRCYCTREETDAEKAKLPPDKQASYRHHCPHRDGRAELDKPYVVRFKVPSEGEVTVHDLVFGELTTPNAAQHDFVLLRTDGVPLYNFGAVVDDVTMGITLVARGRDHIVNTAPQVLLYRALGAAVPQFAHLPMMMANKKEKLSKRTGSVSVTEYRDKGWTAEGLLSYLVRFGWSCGDEELFTLASLVDKFDWKDVGKSDGIYDLRKCGAINEKYVAKLAPVPVLVDGVRPFLRARGVDVPPDDPRLVPAIATVRERALTRPAPGAPSKDGPPPLAYGPLDTMADAMEFYFRDAPAFDEKAAAKYLVPDAAAHLDALAGVVDAVEPTFDVASVKGAIEAWLARENLEIKTVAQPARVALTGRSASPGLYELIAVLGREATSRRLRAGARIARANPAPAPAGGGG